MAAAENNLLEIESEVVKLVTDLYDIFSNTDTHNVNETQKILGRYIKHIAKIGLRVRKSGCDDLQDYCVMFQEILRNIRKQDRILLEDECIQLEIWPSLIMSTISSPLNSEYIDEIKVFTDNPIWNKNTTSKIENISQNNPDTNSINENNVAPLESNKSVESLEIITHEADHTKLLEYVQQEILESSAELIGGLSNDPDQPQIKTSLNLYADRIEILALSMTAEGYIGLMDVFMFYQLGLHQLAKMETIQETEASTIEYFSGVLVSYIASPTDESAINSLVDSLKEISWIPLNSDSESQTLKELLLSNDLKIEQPENQPLSNIENADSDETAETNDNSTCIVDDISEERRNFLADKLINLVAEELTIEIDLLSSLTDVLTSNNDNEKKLQALENYRSILQRFSTAIESVGLQGLYNRLTHIEENLTYYLKQSTIPNNPTLQLLTDLPNLILKYLVELDNLEFTKHFVSSIVQPTWPIEINLSEEHLIKELFSPKIIIEDETENRATLATENDISLELPKDVNQNLLNSLLQELPIQTSEFSLTVTKIENGTSTLNDLENAQRIAHTLKGAANTVGITGIATLTHHIEDILTAFAKHKVLPGKVLANLLLDAADMLEVMTEVLLGISEKPNQALSVLQNILNWANQIDQDGIPNDSIPLNTAEQASDESLTDDNSIDATTNQHIQSTENMLRVPASFIDKLLTLAGESIIMGAQLQEHLKLASQQNQLTLQQNNLFQQLVFDLENIVDIQRLASKQTQNSMTDVFDALELEQYNELHTLTHRLVESVTDSKEITQNIDDELTELESLLVEQSRIHKENQDVVMQTRMVPFQNIVPRLQRSIRQTSRLTDKNVALNITGSDTFLDNDVLNEIAEPLMHILRNAIAHGIESPEQRESKNKNASGQLTIDCFREGEHIVLRCSDDGAGLNYEAIKKTAIEKNLIKETDEISDEELTKLIRLSGFTTTTETTQVSGRGIGMDVVYNQITSLKGSLTINSTTDVGCIFEIRLPLTLISVHSILIEHRDQILALSNRGIEQILSANDGTIELEEGNIKFHYGNETYNAFDIETLLHQASISNDERKQRSIIIIKDETNTPYALTIKNVIANQELVIKQLGTYIPNIVGIEGATILGNGNVVPVLDLPGLMSTIDTGENIPFYDLSALNTTGHDADIISALVIDDSLTARRSLAEFVEDIGYDVQMARDGIDAIETINSKVPDIILVDLEMPRMNGLEFTSHIRASKELKHIPIIMVTSRTTEKHRELALSLGVNAYVTKPFSESELLEHIDLLLSYADQ